MLESFIDWLIKMFKIKTKDVQYLTGQKKCLD